MTAQGGEAATEGHTAADGSGAVQSLDFTQPSKFTAELRRRISVAIEGACEGLTAALTASLRATVELELEEVGQNTWAAAKARLAPDAVAVAIGDGRPERSMLMAVELPFVLQALECMLGGKASQAPQERRLTDIDWALAKGLIETIAGELSSAWDELGGGKLTAGGLDMEGDGGVAVSPSEPTLSIRLRSRIDGCQASMSLLLPFQAVEPIADGQARLALGTGGGRDGGEARALSSGLSAAQVLLRGEIGSVQMPIQQMLAIGPGAVVELGGRARDGVLLYAEEVSIGHGQPGASGNRKAIKLQALREQPVKADTYATLGRAELERARAHSLAGAEEAASPSILRSIFVRVWAELGRTHMALGRTLTLAPGAVVELDQATDAPIELFANGLCFARGALVVRSDGGWGVKVEEVM